MAENPPEAARLAEAPRIGMGEIFARVAERPKEPSNQSVCAISTSVEKPEMVLAEIDAQQKKDAEGKPTGEWDKPDERRKVDKTALIVSWLKKADGSQYLSLTGDQILALPGEVKDVLENMGLSGVLFYTDGDRRAGAMATVIFLNYIRESAVAQPPKTPTQLIRDGLNFANEVIVLFNQLGREDKKDQWRDATCSVAVALVDKDGAISSSCVGNGEVVVLDHDGSELGGYSQPGLKKIGKSEGQIIEDKNIRTEPSDGHRKMVFLGTEGIHSELSIRPKADETLTEIGNSIIAHKKSISSGEVRKGKEEGEEPVEKKPPAPVVIPQHVEPAQALAQLAGRELYSHIEDTTREYSLVEAERTLGEEAITAVSSFVDRALADGELTQILDQRAAKDPRFIGKKVPKEVIRRILASEAINDVVMETTYYRNRDRENPFLKFFDNNRGSISEVGDVSLSMTLDYLKAREITNYNRQKRKDFAKRLLPSRREIQPDVVESADSYLSPSGDFESVLGKEEYYTDRLVFQVIKRQLVPAETILRWEALRQGYLSQEGSADEQLVKMIKEQYRWDEKIRDVLRFGRLEDRNRVARGNRVLFDQLNKLLQRFNQEGFLAVATDESRMVLDEAKKESLRQKLGLSVEQFDKIFSQVRKMDIQRQGRIETRYKSLTEPEEGKTVIDFSPGKFRERAFKISNQIIARRLFNPSQDLLEGEEVIRAKKKRQIQTEATTQAREVRPEGKGTLPAPEKPPVVEPPVVKPPVKPPPEGPGVTSAPAVVDVPPHPEPLPPAPAPEGTGPKEPAPKEPLRPAPVPRPAPHEPPTLPAELELTFVSEKQRIGETGNGEKRKGEMEVLEERGREGGRQQMTEDRNRKEFFMKRGLRRFWNVTLGDIATYGKEKSHFLKLLAAAGIHTTTLPYEFVRDVDSAARGIIKNKRKGFFRKLWGGLRDLGHELTFTEKELHRERIAIIRELRLAVVGGTLTAEQKEFIEKNQQLLQKYRGILSADFQAGEALAKRVGTRVGGEYLALRKDVGETRHKETVLLQGTFRDKIITQIALPLLQAGLASGGKVTPETLLGLQIKMQEIFTSSDFISWYDAQETPVKDALRLSLSWGTDFIAQLTDQLLPKLIEARVTSDKLGEYLNTLQLKANVGTVEAGQKGVIQERGFEKAASRQITNDRVVELYQRVREEQGTQLVSGDCLNAAGNRAELLGKITSLGTSRIVMGIGVGTALYGFRAGAGWLGRMVVPVVGGSAVAGVLRGFQEARLFTREYEQHEVERELGYTFSDKARRREQMRGLERHKRHMQSELTSPMLQLVEAIGRGEKVADGEVMKLMGLVADTEARFQISDERGVGLLSADNPQSYQVERTNLEVAKAQARLALSTYLSGNPTQLTSIQNALGIPVLPGQNALDVVIQTLVDAQTQNLERGVGIDPKYLGALQGLTIEKKQSLESRESAFRWARARRVIARGLTTVALGIGGYVVSREVINLAGQAANGIPFVSEWLDKKGLLVQRQIGTRTETNTETLFTPSGTHTQMIDSHQTTIPTGTQWIDDPISGKHDLVLVSDPHHVLINDAQFDASGKLAWDPVGVDSHVQINPGSKIEIISGKDAVAEWDRMATPIHHREYYSYNLPKSQENELRLRTLMEVNPDGKTRTVILDMSSMKGHPGIQYGLDPNPVNIDQAIAEGKTGFAFTLPGHTDKSIWIPDDVDGVRDGLLRLDPTDTVHLVSFPDGSKMTLGAFSQMVLNQEALAKLQPGDIATELYGHRDVFRLGLDGKSGFIQACQLVKRSEGYVIQSDATIGASGVVQAIKEGSEPIIDVSKITQEIKIEVPIFGKFFRGVDFGIPFIWPFRKPLEAPEGVSGETPAIFDRPSTTPPSPAPPAPPSISADEKAKLIEDVEKLREDIAGMESLPRPRTAEEEMELAQKKQQLTDLESRLTPPTEQLTDEQKKYHEYLEFKEEARESLLEALNRYIKGEFNEEEKKEFEKIYGAKPDSLLVVDEGGKPKVNDEALDKLLDIIYIEDQLPKVYPTDKIRQRLQEITVEETRNIPDDDKGLIARVETNLINNPKIKDINEAINAKIIEQKLKNPEKAIDEEERARINLQIATIGNSVFQELGVKDLSYEDYVKYRKLLDELEKRVGERINREEFEPERRKIRQQLAVWEAAAAIKPPEDLTKEKPLMTIKIGFSQDQNPQHRKEMEDAHRVITNFGNNPKRTFMGIYDGHGGVDVPNYCSTRLSELLLYYLNQGLGVPGAFRAAYGYTDKEIIDSGKEGGATALTIFIDGNMLYVANVGDARAVLGRNGTALRLSHDHKAGDSDERGRIEKAGGTVNEKGQVLVYIPVGDKVKALTLGVSRAFGDREFKESNTIISEPYLFQTQLQHGDDVLILACDGLWDVVSDDEAIDIVKGITDPQLASDKLKQLALQKGSTDNITVMIVYLNPNA